jgi:hypothetical protein
VVSGVTDSLAPTGQLLHYQIIGLKIPDSPGVMMHMLRSDGGFFQWSALLAVLALALSSGCGGCEGATATNNTQTEQDTGLCMGGVCPEDAGFDVDPGQDTSADTASDTTAESDSDDSGEACAAENICGSECCVVDELCLNDTCVTPGSNCAHNLECSGSEICEPTLGKCIPDPGITCEWRPPAQVFDPQVTLAWTDDDNTPAPEYKQVMMTPAVIDIDENGSPDIVFSTFQGSSYNAGSVLRAVDGETFQTIFDLTDVAKHVSGSASLAIGDIDTDGRNEIVAVRPGGSGLIAFDDHTTNWSIMWETDPFSMSWDGATLVDLNADGLVEVVAANRVFSGTTGALQCVSSGISGQPLNTTAADLDDDGMQEVIAADGAFDFEPDGQGGFSCGNYWTYSGGGGGFPAVGDFGTFTNDQRLFGQFDGVPEIVTTSGQQIHLNNGQTGVNIWSKTLPGTDHAIYSDTQCSSANGIGPPTVADFDGDGVPEIGAAGACFYVVYDTDGTILWKHSSQDFSSRITGSSVFDFQGDGKAEVVYADECFIRVYDGTGNGDGTTEVLFKRSHTSGTTRELPVIVDVDNDFHAEIVLISNDYSGVGNRCTANWPDFGALGGEERGILVVEDSQNRWVSTRPVWNQYTYHVTNVCDGIDDQLCAGRPNTVGAIPIGKQANWKIDYLNNFRQNVQGEGLFNAPDLQITNVKTDCNTDGLKLRLTIANRGTRGVRAGVEVAVWATVGGTEQFLTTLTTTQDLAPGGRETLEYIWVDAPDPSGQTISIRAAADSSELGDQQHNECKEDNNETINEATCACQEDSDCDPEEFCSNNGQCIPFDG